ncbi:hypothetical protein SAMN05444673_3967 [Bacillus sp. OV166]|uniref:hypothetical protein n=1 Tax=Bacillus sp. OV166 TaxID=1882763 RepID=UPI000A2AB0E7|nr:hypothetical protein [Bacillus sp. OV166]SMQ80655.1 hypothetical protein SAMN05444673_3967 [Bacillus sp. OV166]
MNKLWGFLLFIATLVIAAYSVITNNNDVAKYGILFIGCINTIIGVKQIKQKDDKNGTLSILLGITGIILSVLAW